MTEERGVPVWLFEHESRPVVVTDTADDLIFYWNLILLGATIAAAWYGWRQLRQPYAFRSWRVGWASLLVTIIALFLRRAVEIKYPLDVNLLWWWPWFAAIDSAVMPTILIVSLLLAMVMFSHIFQQPLTTLEQVYSPAQISIDRDSLVKEWNDEAVRMFGYTVAQAMGQPLTELIMPPRYREDHRRGVARLLERDIRDLVGMEKIYVVMAYRADRPDREFPIEVTVRIEVDADGEPLFQSRIRKLLAF